MESGNHILTYLVLIYLVVGLSVYLINSCVYLYKFHSFCSFACLFSLWVTYLFSYLLTHWLTHSFAHSLAHTLTTRSIAYLLTRVLASLLTCLPYYYWSSICLFSPRDSILAILLASVCFNVFVATITSSAASYLSVVIYRPCCSHSSVFPIFTLRFTDSSLLQAEIINWFLFWSDILGGKWCPTPALNTI